MDGHPLTSNRIISEQDPRGFATTILDTRIVNTAVMNIHLKNSLGHRSTIRLEDEVIEHLEDVSQVPAEP